MELLLTGFAMGFAAAPACLAWCLPLVLPLSFASAVTGRWPVVRHLTLFLAGRLAGYLLFGALAGWLGSAIAADRLAPLTPWLYLGGAILLLFALRHQPGHRRCAVRPDWPFLTLGFATGFNLCPPFLAAAGVALTLGSIPLSLAFFTAFFLGTSLYLLPLPLLQPAARLRWLAPVARAGTVITAGWLIVSAAGMLLPQSVAAPSAGGADPRTLLPGIDRIAAAPTAYPCHLLYDRAGALAGIAFITDEVVPGITGFNGPVPLQLALAPDGTISAARFLPNRETSAWFAKLLQPLWSDLLVGRRINDPLVPGQDIDAVSGATISAAAAASGVRLAGRTVQRDLFGIAPVAAPASTALPWRALVVLLFCGAAIYGFARAAARWRLLLLFASVMVLGLWLREFVSLEHIFALLRGGLTNAAGVFILLLFALAAAVLVGRVYCGWLCPFGALQELLARLRPPGHLPLPAKPPSRVRWLKYATLAATVALLVMGTPSPFLLEPFLPAFTLTATPIIAGFVIFMLFSSLLVPRYFCRFFCPLGALLALLARLAPARWPAGSPAVCPTGALYGIAGNPPARDIGECIECRACASRRARRAGQPGQ